MSQDLEMMLMQFGWVLVIPALLVLYWIIRLARRPSWRLQPHYKTLSSRLNSPRQLAHEQATELAPWPPAIVSFDHANNMGRINYIVNISLPEREFFPKHVSMQEWRIPPSLVTHEYEGEPIYAQVACSHKAHFFALRAFEVVDAMIKGMSNHDLLGYIQAHPHLDQRGHHYDHAVKTLTWSFYIRDELFVEQGDMGDKSRLIQLESLLAPLIQMLDACVPAHRDDAQKWMAMSRAAHRVNGHQVYCVEHVLTRHGDAPGFKAFWEHHIAQKELPVLEKLFAHDHARFVRDVTPKTLYYFALHLLQEHTQMRPEVFASRFARKLPFEILDDDLLTMAHRAELVRVWFAERQDDPQFEQVHQLIANWSKRQQSQLRTLLDADSSMSGALSASFGEAGQITMSHQED